MAIIPEIIMDNTQKMSALLRKLRTEMNGAVVDSMREMGISYNLSYGVSIPTIRRIATEFAPDHELAKFLYRQDVRELKIAAFTIADPAAITEDELDFWASEIGNSEIAENLATTLLGRSGVVNMVFLGWLDSGSPLLQYAALLAGTRHIAFGNDVSIEWEDGLSGVFRCLEAGDPLVWKGGALFLSRLMERFPKSVAPVKSFMHRADEQSLPCAEYMRYELAWQINSPAD